MAVAEKVLSGLVLTVCLVLLVRLVLSSRLRYRLDRQAATLWRGFRHSVRRLTQRRPARPIKPVDAAMVAEEAIRRAQEGSWRGNVYTPKSFRKPRKPH